MITSNLDRLALMRLGIVVNNPAQLEQVLAIVQADPADKEQLQKARSSLKTMTSKNAFIQAIIEAHANITQIAGIEQNISYSEGTYLFIPIKPSSQTERAFFNAFKVKALGPNDQKPQILMQGAHCQENQDRPLAAGEDYAEYHRQHEAQNSVCYICKRAIGDEVGVIKCSKDQMCRGFTWYHAACIPATARFEHDQRSFLCPPCLGTQPQELRQPNPVKLFRRS